VNSILDQLLGSIPKGRLVRLIGPEVEDALSSYSNAFDSGPINPIQTLLLRFGDGLLAEKSVYDTIMDWIDPKLAICLCETLGIPFQTGDEAVKRLKEIDIRIQNEDFLKSFAHLCGLDLEAYNRKEAGSDIEGTTWVKPFRPLHNFQKRIKDEVIREILSPDGSSSLLVHMPTGSGKTKTCMEALVDFHRAKSALGGHDFSGFVVWLAHSKELCEQACDTFQNLWERRGDYPLPIVRLYGSAEYTDQLLENDDAMIFASFQKFNAMRTSSKRLQSKLASRIPGNTRLVVVDEAHRSLAKTYGDAIVTLTSGPGTRLIGLTATPGRSADLNDQQNKYLRQFFGGSKIGLKNDDGVPIANPIQYLTNRKFLAQIERIELKTNCDIHIEDEQDVLTFKEAGDQTLTEQILLQASSSLASDPGRNHLLLTAIKDAYEMGDSILVFTCSVEHCVILEALLSNIGIESASILGTSTKEARERRIEEFKNSKLKVLLNFGVLSTGFDAPRLNTLIIARPVSSIVLYSQIIGRALRGPFNGGNAKNKVIDLIDNINIMGEPSRQFSHFDQLWNSK